MRKVKLRSRSVPSGNTSPPLDIQCAEWCLFISQPLIVLCLLRYVDYSNNICGLCVLAKESMQSDLLSNLCCQPYDASDISMECLLRF